MSRILLWSPNYAPELTGIPPLVTDAAEGLVARGHEVTVVAPMPNYPQRRIQEAYRGRFFDTERRNGVTVRRAWLRVRPGERFLDKATYEVTAATMGAPLVLASLRDVDVLVCVVPTLTAALYATALPRRPRVVLWVQDLVLRAAGALDLPRGAGGVLGRLAAAERRVVARADDVVVCSPGFRDHFAAAGCDPAKLHVLFNWADLSTIDGAPRARSDGPLRLLYSGNLGYTQGLETLIRAAELARDDVEVSIVGDGNAAPEIRRLASTVRNVTVASPVPRAGFPSLLAAHDAHVVVQRRAAAGANLPSKIASYLASGRPVVASIDRRTPAADLLRDSGGSIIVEPESPEALAEAIRELRSEPQRRAELGRNARAYAEMYLSKDAAIDRLERLLLGR